MLNEDFYRVDKNGFREKDGQNMRSAGWRPGYIGYYYNAQQYKGQKPIDRMVWVKNFDDFNDKETFEKAVHNKGKAAQLAYQYNIMQNYETKEDRVINWLAQDSYYNEDNFFYVTDVPGYKDKKIAFQLRLSNHFINPRQWLKSHMRRLYQKPGQLGRTPQLAQFGLGIMVDRLVDEPEKQNDIRLTDPEDVKMYQTYGMTFYEIDLFLDEKSEDEKKMIADFLTKVGNGQAFTISFNQLEQMFGKFPLPHIYGGEKYDDVNFTERPRIKGRRGALYPFKEPKTIPTIKYDDVAKIIDSKQYEEKIIDGKTYYLFVHDGENLAYDPDDMKVYRRRVKSGKPIDKIDYGTEFQILEKRIRLSQNDLAYIVNECVEQILRKRGLV